MPPFESPTRTQLENPRSPTRPNIECLLDPLAGALGIEGLLQLRGGGPWIVTVTGTVTVNEHFTAAY
jgi:hypothetical protein